MEAVRDISTRAQQTGLVRALPQSEETHALVPVADPGSPLPVFSGEQMAEAFRAYRQLQVTLDAAMPDAIMNISGKRFRKKQYWRAVCTAFNLSVEIVSEERVVLDGDWGWNIVCRAKTASGRTEDGDGACYASEKPGRGQATEHNVRSHAHTRAFNRAVSNLVGFGEVSAEEADREERPRQAPPPPRQVGSSSTVDSALISEPQRKRLFAIARENGWQNEDVAEFLSNTYNIDSTSKIPKAHYEAIIAALQVPNDQPQEPVGDNPF